MTIHYEVSGDIARFTIDRGELSIFTPAMHRQLHDALRSFVLDAQVRVGILSAVPGRSFCAGDDIKLNLPRRSKQEELEQYLFLHAGEAPDEQRRPGWEVDVMKMERYKPIIGAVDKYCLGQGMVYLLHLTDIRIATRRASFGFPEIAYGMGGGGGHSRLGRQIPHTTAMYHLLTGERMNAEQALECHLVNELVDDAEQLQQRCLEIARKIAAQPPVAVRVEMESYYHSLDSTREENLRYANNLYRLQRMGFEGYGAGSDFLGKAK